MQQDQFQFFYPNRMGKIIFRALEEIGGEEKYLHVVEAANLQHLLGEPLSGDLEREFPFEYVARLQEGVESVFGVEEGREVNRKVGRACLAGGLQEFNPLLGIADLPMRVMPLGMKLHVGFDMFAMVFNRFSDQVVTLSEDTDNYLWIIERCPVCWQRKTDAACCHLAVGILEESLKWVSGGREFDVAEIACIAKGDETCTMCITKRPLKA